jgi:hypothetical protein
LSLVGCGVEGTARIFHVEGAKIASGKMEATDMRVQHWRSPPGHVSIDIHFHDDTPCTNLTVGVCNLEDEGPFELRDFWLECDPESLAYVPAKAAHVSVSTGCDPLEMTYESWRSVAGSVRLTSRDDTVGVSVTADMAGSGTFTIEASAELDREDVQPIGSAEE